MEELIEELESLFDQKLEVTYGDDIVIESSPSNPPEMRHFHLKYSDEEEAIANLEFIIGITKSES